MRALLGIAGTALIIAGIIGFVTVSSAFAGLEASDEVDVARWVAMAQAGFVPIT